MIRDHWFRAASLTGSCLFPACGLPREAHLEACGEWLGPRHWFRPGVRRLTRCGRCARPFDHSTHRGTKARRRLWGGRR